MLHIRSITLSPNETKPGATWDNTSFGDSDGDGDDHLFCNFSSSALSVSGWLVVIPILAIYRPCFSLSTPSIRIGKFFGEKWENDISKSNETLKRFCDYHVL